MITIKRCKNEFCGRLILIVGKNIWHISHKEARYLFKRLKLLKVNKRTK